MTGRSDAVPPPRVEPPRTAPKRMLKTERPIASAISLVSNVPAAPTSVPAISSSAVAEHVTAGRDGQTGEGVQQRDDDRYVGAAHRQHQHHTDRETDQAEQYADPHARLRDQPARQGDATEDARR